MPELCALARDSTTDRAPQLPPQMGHRRDDDCCGFDGGVFRFCQRISDLDYVADASFSPHCVPHEGSRRGEG